MELNNGLIFGLAMAVVGGVLLLLGQRQRKRTEIGEVPLTSWHFKLFFGGALFIIALNVIFHAVVNR